MIKNIQDLQNVKNAYLEKMEQYQYQCLVCYGTGCISSGCKDVRDALVATLEEKGLTDKVAVVEIGCMGTCAVGPVMYVLPDNTYYTEITPDKIPEIVDAHLIGGNPVEKYTFYDTIQRKHITNINEIEFFKGQVRLALRNCGLIDINNINGYISKDGYLALARILEKGDRKAVVEEMKESGLRGRGGAGFPTGIKWEAAYNQEDEEKYYICNADEGDPGAFMDRSVLEGDPHSVIEGMLIGGYAIGAQRGVVYVRAEYPTAVERFSAALEMAREEGLLGKNILGSGFDFDIEIRIGAGAFVCGEETSLMASVEGKRGEPRQKPPFPFQSGLFGHPTIINNVETIATIPAIMLNGAKWFRSFGTEKSPGTKVFALSGDIVNAGLVEVPMGMPLSEIIFKIGGGIPKGKAFKAAQTGGPSGGCITPDNINVPMDYESLAALGSIIGSGGLIVMDEDTCMVDTARFYMDFIQEESCGKCTACRVGTKRMLEILTRITEGKGEEGDIEKLEELGNIIKDSAMCGLGQTAANPVLSTIQFFRNEYENHIKRHICDGGTCSELVVAPCTDRCPASVDIPGYMSLIATGDFTGAAKIMLRENPFAGICGRVCTHPCETRCRRGTVDEAMNICELKRFATDWAFLNGTITAEDFASGKHNGKKVAIIGAGPSGLTCGYYLARLGYEVDCYEAEDRAGGIMCYGIPEYRLPQDMIRREIFQVQATGVKLILNTKVGKDISFADLKEKYGAIYIAVGAQKAVSMGIPGEDLEGVYAGLDFLKENVLKADIDLTGKRVAVIGGGNTAIDSARTAIRLGAKEVNIIYRRTEDCMPADLVEIKDAKAEGVTLQCLTNPVAFVGEKGKLTGLKLVEQTLGDYDASGRRKAVPTDKETVEAYDVAIYAISQTPVFDGLNDGIEMNGKRMANDEWTMATSMEGVFVGGDASRGPTDIVSAVRDGKVAAQNMDLYLGGEGILDKGFEQQGNDYHMEGDIIPHGRFTSRQLTAEEAKKCFDEVNLGMHELDAKAEASRCLRCDRRCE